MPKSYLIILIIILLVIIGAVFYSLFKPKIGPNEAALIINFGETKRAFAGETIEGMTIADALFVSAQAGDFDFDLEEGVLKRIGQFEEDATRKWNVYLNGRKVEDSLNEVLIKNGDKIELKFE